MEQYFLQVLDNHATNCNLKGQQNSPSLTAALNTELSGNRQTSFEHLSENVLNSCE